MKRCTHRAAGPCLFTMVKRPAPKPATISEQPSLWLEDRGQILVSACRYCGRAER